jgi:DNA-binding transcriptional MerR regulator
MTQNIDQDRQYTQKEMSEIFGWSPAWLRRIEIYGLLPDLESKPRRGRKARTYSSADMYHILWVATLRHAGIELSEMKEYVDRANELLGLLKKYEADSGNVLKPVFFHRPHFDEGLFYLQPDSIPVDDLAKIAQLAQWLEDKAHELNHRIRRWYLQMDRIFREMNDLGKQATRSIESMLHINQTCIKNRLLALK